MGPGVWGVVKILHVLRIDTCIPDVEDLGRIIRARKYRSLDRSPFQSPPSGPTLEKSLEAFRRRYCAIETGVGDTIGTKFDFELESSRGSDNPV